MKRIPYGDNKHGVFDNLVEGSELGMAFFDRVMLPLLANEDPCEIYEMYNMKLLAAWRANDSRRYMSGLPWDGKIIG